MINQFVYRDNEPFFEKTYIVTVKKAQHKNGNTALIGYDQYGQFFSIFTVVAGDNMTNERYVQLDNSEAQHYIDDILINMGIIEGEFSNNSSSDYPIYRICEKAYLHLEQDESILD